jgi:hypothetical protein
LHTCSVLELELAEQESNGNSLQAQAAALARSGRSLGVLPSKKPVGELQVNISNSREDLSVEAAQAAEEQLAYRATKAASQAV